MSMDTSSRWVTGGAAPVAAPSLAPGFAAVTGDPSLALPPAPAGGVPDPAPRRKAGARRRATRLLVRVAALTVLAGMVIVNVPLPFVDDYVARTAKQQIAEQLAMPGATTPPKITIKGGRLLTQVLSRQLSQIEVEVPDATIGGVAHAGFASTLRGVSQTGSGTAHADRIDAAITVRFANLPSLPGQPKSTFALAPGGSLAVTVADPGDTAADVKSTVLVKLNVQGEKVTAVPQGMELFGETLPADKVKAITGGARTQALPRLPAGLAYRSITPERDGLHVALGGVVTTPLSTLPTNVGGRTVSYVAENGLLGIRTAVQVPPLINVPLVIFTAPRLTGGTLTLVPALVRALGKDRPPTDPIARIVLSQIKQQDLTRPLPALPRGVAYQSVSVDGAGVKVAVGGVTVRPFSDVSGGPPGGTFSARDGLLTAAYTGTIASGSPMPIVMLARPRISNGSLLIEPQKFLILGALFPAAAVLKEVKIPVTRFPLQALPAHLSYTGVDVLPDGMRIRVSGKDVALTKGLFGNAAPAAAPASK